MAPRLACCGNVWQDGGEVGQRREAAITAPTRHQGPDLRHSSGGGTASAAAMLCRRLLTAKGGRGAEGRAAWRRQGGHRSQECTCLRRVCHLRELGGQGEEGPVHGVVEAPGGHAQQLIHHLAVGDVDEAVGVGEDGEDLGRRGGTLPGELNSTPWIVQVWVLVGGREAKGESGADTLDALTAWLVRSSCRQQGQRSAPAPARPRHQPAGSRRLTRSR
jgi:hypothetical protein